MTPEEQPNTTCDCECHKGESEDGWGHVKIREELKAQLVAAEVQRDSLKAAVAENKKTIKAMDLIRQQQNREIADLRKERDRALAGVERLEKAIREHHELWRNSHGVCFVECKIVCKALAEDDKEAGGCQE